MVRKSRTKASMRPSVKSPGGFGPVTQINTAPVSVGNSVRGSKPRVTQTTDGARVVGRDFAFALSGTASTVTGFELIGGMPITPCALPSSVLRNYCQMFQKFKVHSIVVHYITSSPTSQAGDGLFYYERDALAPMVDYSNSSFLPFVLSDDHTVIGPQWTNHTMVVQPVGDWKTTLFGNQTDINEDKAGTIFMFSKTNAANSPGYILIDYDISFRQLSVNPRAGTLPVARAQSTFVCLTSTASLTAGSSFTWTLATGKTIANLTSAAPTGATTGDIYKVVLQVTASTQVNAAWTGTPAITTANMLQYADDTAITLDDGITFYGRLGTNTLSLYGTIEEAITDTMRLEAQTTSTTPTINLCASLQLVRNISSLTQASY